MILDLVPFHEVNKPGFLRHHQLLVPNFKVASATYYASLLDPTYKKIRGSLEKKLISDNPPTVSIGCDAWSAFHHGYETTFSSGDYLKFINHNPYSTITNC